MKNLTEKDIRFEYQKDTGNNVDNKIELYRSSLNQDYPVIINYLDWLEERYLKMRNEDLKIEEVNEEFDCCGDCDEGCNCVADGEE
jgi:hypothetical protein